jgi:hypothetical protein
LVDALRHVSDHGRRLNLLELDGQSVADVPLIGLAEKRRHEVPDRQKNGG